MSELNNYFLVTYKVFCELSVDFFNISKDNSSGLCLLFMNFQGFMMMN